MNKHVLSPVEFRDARERLFRLLLETASKTKLDFVMVHCDQVYLTTEGAELVGKLFLHLIATEVKGICAVAATDEVAFPIVGILVGSANDRLKGGLLLQSLVKGPRFAPETEVVMIADAITFHTAGHANQVRTSEFKYSVSKLFVLVDYQYEETAEWIARAGLKLTSLFTLQELKAGELDHSRFHLV